MRCPICECSCAIKIPSVFDIGTGIRRYLAGRRTSIKCAAILNNRRTANRYARWRTAWIFGWRRFGAARLISREGCHRASKDHHYCRWNYVWKFHVLVSFEKFYFLSEYGYQNNPSIIFLQNSRLASVFPCNSREREGAQFADLIAEMADFNAAGMDVLFPGEARKLLFQGLEQKRAAVNSDRA